eukprot:Rhum_TRINITY_DN22200_c0_g1::Rhum_TRINITY_DN22200_c0_g1_i1::g.175355::m.175355
MCLDPTRRLLPTNAMMGEEDDRLADMALARFGEAARAGDEIACRQYAAEGLNVDALCDGRTPLQWCAVRRHAGAFGALLECGADAARPVDALHGSSTLLLAAHGGDATLVAEVAARVAAAFPDAAAVRSAWGTAATPALPDGAPAAAAAACAANAAGLTPL